jgi:hypothetical protein
LFFNADLQLKKQLWQFHITLTVFVSNVVTKQFRINNLDCRALGSQRRTMAGCTAQRLMSIVRLCEEQRDEAIQNKTIWIAAM